MTATKQSFDVLVKTSAVIRKKDGRVIDCGVISESKTKFSDRVLAAMFQWPTNESEEKS